MLVSRRLVYVDGIFLYGGEEVVFDDSKFEYYSSCLCKDGNRYLVPTQAVEDLRENGGFAMLPVVRV